MDVAVGVDVEVGVVARVTLNEEEAEVILLVMSAKEPRMRGVVR